MPTQKNQHFVPRCALKPFTVRAEGRAVHLYNLDADRPVQNAPIKGQCSRDYFYGKDLKVENHLGNLEGHYARILGELVNGTNLTRADEDWLRLFTIIQSMRT